MGQLPQPEEEKQAALEMMRSALILLDRTGSPPLAAAYLSQSIDALEQHLEDGKN